MKTLHTILTATALFVVAVICFLPWVWMQLFEEIAHEKGDENV